jgi:hypothetical protein
MSTDMNCNIKRRRGSPECSIVLIDSLRREHEDRHPFDLILKENLEQNKQKDRAPVNSFRKWVIIVYCPESLSLIKLEPSLCSGLKVFKPP